MKTMYNLNELAAELTRQNEAKVDYLAPTDGIHFVTADGKSEVDLTDSQGGLLVGEIGHRNLSGRLSIPWKFYERLRNDLPVLLDENVNRLLRHHPSAPAPKWMVRTLDGTARAFLSDAYRRLDNWEIANAVLPVLADIPDVRFEGCFITEKQMVMKALTPRVLGEVSVGDEVCAGVIIRNSEVGYGSLTVRPIVYRLVCKNGMVAEGNPEGMMRQVHLGRRVQADGVGRIFSDATVEADDRAFMMAVGDVVRAAVDEVRFREVVEQMQRAAETDPIVDVPAAVEVLAQREGLSEAESSSVITHLARGGDLTLWGAVNAVTASAQDAHVSFDRSVELEEIGGKILRYAPRDWKNVCEAVAA